MISGKLSNDTVWWLSRDGLKIWIESIDLEQDKFIKKGYSINHERIFRNGEVGELATSRLESRKGKGAWIIKLGVMEDVYPELIEEIESKKIEEKKKKRPPKINNKKIYPKMIKTNDNIIKEEHKDTTNIEPKKEIFDFFDVKRPYVTWIKDEMDNNGKIIIKSKELKEKMGEEFVSMHDIRIQYGLMKALSGLGIDIELRSLKGETFVVMKKI